MAGYYHDEDLPRFAEMGKNAPELWKKFSEWYGAVFAEGALTRAGEVPDRAGAWRTPCSARTASTPTRRRASRRARTWSR